MQNSIVKLTPIGGQAEMGKSMYCLEIENKIFIIALDTDTSGAKATTDITNALNDLKLTVKPFNITNKYKDINDFLIDDRKALEQAVKSIEDEVIEGKYKFTNGSNLFKQLLDIVFFNSS